MDPATGAQLYWYMIRMIMDNITNEYISSDYQKAANSKYYSGSRIPDLYGSINTDFSYKNFDLSILGTYSIGGKFMIHYTLVLWRLCMQAIHGTNML